MAQISVNNLTFYHDGSFDNIFENVSFSIDSNWKLGFIGRNGKGKSTFLNILLGKYKYQGSITKSMVFDYFPYQIAREQMQLPVAEFMEEIKVGCEAWRVICELSKLDEDAEIFRENQAIAKADLNGWELDKNIYIATRKDASSLEKSSS